MNHAPRMPAILLALALTLVGLLGRFGAARARWCFDSATLGIWALLAGFVVLMAGIGFQGI